MNNDIKNVGVIDRVIRAVIGIGLLLFAWEYDGSILISLVASIVGVALLLSSVTGFCFILRMLGLSTCNNKKKGPQ